MGVLGVVVFAGFSGKDDAATSAETIGSNPGAIDDSLLTVPATTLAPVVIGSDPTIVKTQLSQTLSKGMWGDEVKALQQRLHDLGFDPGPVDGQFGSGTEQALWAFEGLYSGLKYDQQTGKLTNDLWQAMQDPLVFQPRRQGGVGNTHMEIYLDLQVGIVFTDDKAVLITHISSGELDENGEPKLWCELTTYNTNEYGEPLDEPITRDECGYSKTPGGVFKFYRRYEGNRVGPLGGMWNPVYFNYGIAVHGAKNVPNKPASHGCIRIPMHIADYFPSLVANGNRVYVWDGKLEPEQQSKNSMLPSFNFPNPDSTTTSSTTSTTSTTTTVKPTTTTVKATTTTTKPTTTTTSAPPTTSTTVPTETT
ncbi:MAG: L,D-transpeptidase family protein [Ilumatobacteraceae bacterium]